MKPSKRRPARTLPSAGGGLLAVLGLLATSGCWGGTIGLVAAASGGGGGGTRTVIATALAVQTPEDGQSGRVPLVMNVQFDPAQTVRLQAVRYSLVGGDSGFQDVTPARGFPTEVLPETTMGSGAAASAFPVRSTDGSIQPYRFDWNSHFDVDLQQRNGDISRPSTARAVLQVSIRNESTGQTLTATTQPFFLDQSLVRTVAGGGVGDGIDPRFATMLDPVGMAAGSSGELFVADSGNSRLRSIGLDPADPALARTIETRIGNGFSGISTGFRPARATGMATPIAVEATAVGNLFTAENDPFETDAARQGVVRYFDRASGLVVNAIVTDVIAPQGLALEDDRILYVSDTGLNGVRVFDLDGRDPLVDDLDAFSDLSGVIVDTDGDDVADSSFTQVAGVAFAAGARSLFVADLAPTPLVHQIRLDVAPPLAVPIAGLGAVDPTDPGAALGADARDLALSQPSAVSADPRLLFIADRQLGVVVVVRRSDNRVLNVLTGFVEPAGVERSGDAVYVCEASDGSLTAAKNAHRITVITRPEDPVAALWRPLAAGNATKVPTQGLDAITVQSTCFTGVDENTNGCGSDDSSGTDGDAASVAASDVVRGQATGVKAAATESPLARPEDLVLDRARDLFYVADTGNRLICKVDESTGLMTGVAGSLTSITLPDATERDARSVQLRRPVALGLGSAGLQLFVADATDTASGGNVVRIRLGAVADESDNLARVILPNASEDPDSPLNSPVAVAAVTLSNRAFLFVADAGVPGSVAPQLLKAELSDLEDGVDPGEVQIVSAQEFLQVCEDDADNVPGDPADRQAPIEFRFLRDLYPVPQTDGSLCLLVAADLNDNLLELGDLAGGGGALQGAIEAFEADCYDGLDDDGDGLVDFDDPDCAVPMRQVVLAYDFDASGNFQDAQFLVYGFKRFVLDLDDADVNCGCTNPAVGSAVDDPELVLERIAASPDLGHVYASDPCRNQVRFHEIDRALAFPVVRFGTALGAEFENSDPFDGALPIDTALGRPRGLEVDDLDDVYVADVLNNRIRRSWVGDQLRFR